MFISVYCLFFHFFYCHLFHKFLWREINSLAETLPHLSTLTSKNVLHLNCKYLTQQLCIFSFGEKTSIQDASSFSSNFEPRIIQKGSLSGSKFNFTTETPTCIISIKIVTHIFVAKIFTGINIAETSNCIIATDVDSCIIATESVSCIVPTETAPCRIDYRNFHLQKWWQSDIALVIRKKFSE